MGIIWKTIADNWGIILMAPGVFIAAILLGWLAGWMVVRLVYNQRLAHQQDMITNLRAVLEEKLPTSFLSPPQQKRSKQMSFGLVLIFAGIGAALIGATIVTSDRSPPPSKQPPNMEPGVSTLPQAPTIAALPDPKIADLQSQLDATKAQFETTRKELADVRLTPTAEKDIQQNRLRFKLEQAKIDKADFDNAIAAVRASAEGVECCKGLGNKSAGICSWQYALARGAELGGSDKGATKTVRQGFSGRGVRRHAARANSQGTHIPSPGR